MILWTPRNSTRSRMQRAFRSSSRVERAPSNDVHIRGRGEVVVVPTARVHPSYAAHLVVVCRSFRHGGIARHFVVVGFFFPCGLRWFISRQASQWKGQRARPRL